MTPDATPASEGRGGPDIFLIAGESSGDELGAALIDAIRAAEPGAAFRGVGGSAMTERGMTSLFPMSDIAVMGILPVLRHARRLLARISLTAKTVIDTPPDVLVIIDSPDFTHRVARRVRAARPDIPIVNYVSPSVWAWRPGRAARMRSYVDHVLALLPFEPAAHAELGGPPCTYVGHPLIERLPILRPDGVTRSGVQAPLLAVLPGSRRSEIQRLMPVFGVAVAHLKQQFPALQVVLPAVTHVRKDIEAAAAQWDLSPEIVSGDEAKFHSFASARAALAASGTVTLELALSRTPAVLAYKLSRVEFEFARRVVRTPLIGLPNIIAGRAVIPEFIQHEASAENLARALRPLLADGEERQRQLAAFDEIERVMTVEDGKDPSIVSARIVLGLARSGRGAS